MWVRIEEDPVYLFCCPASLRSIDQMSRKDLKATGHVIQVYRPKKQRMVQIQSDEPVKNANFIQVREALYCFDFSGYDVPRQETRVTTLKFNFVRETI